MSVIEIYHTFTGREPDKSYRVRLPAGTRAPGHMAQLGQVRYVEGFVGRGAGRFAAVHEYRKYPGVQLLASGQGKLYFYDPAGGLMPLSAVATITYQADRGEGKQVYEHKFTRPFPRLEAIPDSQGHLAKLAGGGYRIEVRGIVS